MIWAASTSQDYVFYSDQKKAKFCKAVRIIEVKLPMEFVFLDT